MKNQNKLMIVFLFVVVGLVISIGLLSIEVNALDKINPQPLPIKICRTVYDIKEATEQVTNTIQVQVMENQTVSYSAIDRNKTREQMLDYHTSIKTALSDYKEQLSSYNQKIKTNHNLELSKPILSMPTIPEPATITLTKIVQVPKVENKTTYFIDWLNFKIGSKTTQIYFYENKSVTTNKIKSGYSFDKDTGEFYKMENC